MGPIMTERRLFIIIGGTSIFVSLCGVIIAAFVVVDASHGGRGGAIGVAIALVAFFATRNYAGEVYDALTNPAKNVKTRILKLTKGTLHEKPELDSPAHKLKALEARLNLERQGQMMQNIWLAVSTGIGTIFWGFGDLFAKWIM